MSWNRTGASSNAGRWAVHRERTRVSSPVPEAEFLEARTLSGVLPDVMKRFGLQERQWLQELESEWAQLVGPDVARHTRPGRLDKGWLTVFVDSSVWLNELVRYGKQALLAKLQGRFGGDKIRHLALRLDPDAPPSA